MSRRPISSRPRARASYLTCCARPSPNSARRGAPPATRTPAGAVLHRPARACRRWRRPRAAAHRPRPREPRDRAAAARRRARSTRGRAAAACTATRRSAGCPSCGRRSPTRYRDALRRRARPRPRGRRRPGHQDGARRALPRARRARRNRPACPIPCYPDYLSGPALAGARSGLLPLLRSGGWKPDFTRAPVEDVAAVYLNYPSNPCAVAVPRGIFEEAVEYAHRTGAAVVHDFAYGDLVFDGREPQSFLATPGAKEVGVELFSMSKSYGMAGWRLGFVVGNAEIVERINLLNDHCRVGIFRADPGGRHRGADRAAGLGRRAARHATSAAATVVLDGARTARPARARSTSGSSSRRAHRRRAAHGAPRRGRAG